MFGVARGNQMTPRRRQGGGGGGGGGSASASPGSNSHHSGGGGSVLSPEMYEGEVLQMVDEVSVSRSPGSPSHEASVPLQHQNQSSQGQGGGDNGSDGVGVSQEGLERQVREAQQRLAEVKPAGPYVPKSYDR